MVYKTTISLDKSDWIFFLFKITKSIPFFLFNLSLENNFASFKIIFIKLLLLECPDCC